MARKKRTLKLNPVKPIHQRISHHRVCDTKWLNSLNIKEISKNLSIKEKEELDLEEISKDINFALNEYITEEEYSRYAELYKIEDDDWLSHTSSWVDEGQLIFQIYNSGLYWGAISDEKLEILKKLICEIKPKLKEIDETISLIKKDFSKNKTRGRKFDYNKKEFILKLKKIFTENYDGKFSISTSNGTNRGGKALRWCQEIIRASNKRRFVETPLRNLAHWAEMTDALADTIKWVNRIPEEGD